MKINKISTPSSSLNALDGVSRQKIDKINWSEYPVKPNVDFAIAHDGDNVYINYKVNEDGSLARVLEDHGEVWTDSCVEFFISFGDDGYYNFEFTCIGTALMAFRKDKDNATPASAAIMSTIKRFSSLERVQFEETFVEEWQVTVIIPKEAFFNHSFTDLSGVNATANFYKCGDNLSKPHFVSWNKIDNETPNFHLPRCFGPIVFE